MLGEQLKQVAVKRRNHRFGVIKCQRITCNHIIRLAVCCFKALDLQIIERAVNIAELRIRVFLFRHGTEIRAVCLIGFVQIRAGVFNFAIEYRKHMCRTYHANDFQQRADKPQHALYRPTVRPENSRRHAEKHLKQQVAAVDKQEFSHGLISSNFSKFRI